MSDLATFQKFKAPLHVATPPKWETIDPPLVIQGEVSAVKSDKTSSGNDFHFRRQPINLKWHNITYTTNDGKNILKGLTGKAESGKLLAIMGPSGAGKSTLLNVLSGFTRSKVGGSITVNGAPRTMRVSVSCYIMQDDHLLPHLTVRETIQLAARLKIPSTVPKEEREKAVEASLDALGLREQQNNRANQLSGGQRKRLCIAQELVCNPYLFFLDEPTSGLDSASCLQCIQLLKSLAQEGRTVICTIHQPSSRVFELFDKLYMLANGHCIYKGSTKNLIPFLRKQGLSCPTYCNPADFFMEVASGERGDWVWKLKNTLITHEGIKVLSLLIEKTHYDECLPDGHHISNLNLLENQKTNKPFQSNAADSKSSPRGYATSSWNQFKVLTYRSLIGILREPMATHVRLAAHVLEGILIGLVYYGIGNDASKILNNSGCLVFSLIALLYTSMMPTLLTFPLEKTIFAREHINRWYSTKMYYLAKTCSEIPFQILFPVIFCSIVYWLTDQPNDPWRFLLYILSSIMSSLLAQSVGLIIGAATSVQNAVFLGPVSLIPFTLFSGFFINLDNIPHYLQWLSSLSYIRYCFQSMVRVIYGFNRTELYCAEKFCPFQEPEHFLREMAMDGGYLSVDFAAMWTFFFVFRVIAYYVLYYMVIYNR